jgi:predicted MFS family arabinose efflux permease
MGIAPPADASPTEGAQSNLLPLIFNRDYMLLRSGLVIIAIGWIKAALYFCFLASPNFVVLGVILGLSWLTSPVYNVVQFSYRLALKPDKLQGRMNSLFRLLAFGFNPLGAALSGLLLSSMGTASSIVAFGLVSGLLALATTMNRHVRNARPIGKVMADQ